MKNLFKEIKQKADDLVKEASELSNMIQTSQFEIKSKLEGVLASTEGVKELFGISGREEQVALEMLNNDFEENVDESEIETDEVEELVSKCDNQGVDDYQAERDHDTTF